MRGKRYCTHTNVQMKIKSSYYRNYVAKVLKTWRDKTKGNYNVSQTARLVGMSKVSVHRALQQSKFFMRHPKKWRNATNKNSYENQMTIKNSETRNRVAWYLRTWRKYYSLKQAANSIHIHLSYFGKILMLSKRYRCQKKYSHQDACFSLRWAKKKLAAEILGNKCCDCGTTDQFSFDFHHDGDDKENTICDMMSGGFPWEEIEVEIKKCVLLCRNCHQKRHIDIDRVNRLSLIIQQKITQIKTFKYKA